MNSVHGGDGWLNEAASRGSTRHNARNVQFAAEHLIRKADEYRALGEEHTDSSDDLLARLPYMLVELSLRAVAQALIEAAEHDREAA